MSTSSKFNNVADFGTYDGGDMYYSIVLSASDITSKVISSALSNNVQTSNTSPYPTGYCDYRLFSDRNNKGLGGGCQSGGDYGMHTSSGAISTNTDYLFEIELHNNSMAGKITKISDNTVVYNETITPPKDFTNWHFCMFLFYGGSDSTTITYKEVKIKPL